MESAQKMDDVPKLSPQHREALETFDALVRRHGARDDAHAALGGLVVRGERDDVGGIGVEIELGVGRIPATAGGAIGRAFVAHRGEVLRGLALRARDAGVEPDRPRKQLELFRGKTFAWKPAHERDAASALGLAKRGLDHRQRGTQVEIGALVFEQRLAWLASFANGLGELAAGALVQREDPVTVGAQVLGGPGGGGMGRHGIHVIATKSGSPCCSRSNFRNSK